MLLGLATPLAAIGQFHAPTKEELQMTSDPAAPGAAAVYLYREEIQDDPHHFHSVYARIKILKDSGTELATVHINYRKSFVFSATGDNSSHLGNGFATNFDLPDVNRTGEDRPNGTDTFVGHIEIGALQGRTIHPDGTIVPMTEKQADLLKEKIGNNQMNELTFTLPDAHKGDILEYYYQVRYDRFNQAPYWQVQQPFFVHKEHFVFIPDSQFTHLDVAGAGVSDAKMYGQFGEVETDIRATSVLPPEGKVQQDALGHYYVDLTNIPPIPQEPFSPPISGQIYHVEFYYIFTPSEKEFWQTEMNLWTKALGKYIAPTSLITSTAKEITSGVATPLDKAKKLYALVQTFDNQDLDRRATVAPDDGSIPYGSVEQVLEAKRGGSRQLTWLYLSLARAAGLDARPIRLASRDLHLFSASTLDTSQLDSIIVGIMIDGKEIYVDPGERMAPFETLYWAHAGAGGVALQSDGKVETLITPLQDNRSNTVVHVGTLNLSPQGEVSGTLKVGFIGQQALAWRQLALRIGAGAVQQQMQMGFDAELPAGVQAHIEQIAGLDDPNRQLVAIIPVTGMLATSAGKHIVLPRLFFDTKDVDPFPEEAQRVWPVDMHYPAQEQEQITYKLPDGFKLENPPADVNLHWAENAAYIVRTQTAANSVTNARILARGFTVLDPSQYSQLRDFYQKVAQDDHQQIVLDHAN
ncbi:MAG TPA: transglutaminase-like domain-containing protein [Terracidiphilus sp.]|nr:transglutaminase-like domain-containing protein [Terracidiphilus sp.]